MGCFNQRTQLFALDLSQPIGFSDNFNSVPKAVQPKSNKVSAQLGFFILSTFLECYFFDFSEYSKIKIKEF